MGRLSLERKKTLNKIKEMRFIIKKIIDKGLITENDVLYFSRLTYPYTAYYDSKKTFNRTKYLNQIFTSPFLLCDQENLKINIKVLLPNLLEYRYNYEIEELKYQLDKGYITKEEYNNMEDDLYFAYYLSSEDGKSIIKNGKVKGIGKNVLIKTK